MSYAAQTEVSVEKSRAELERTLARYGATHFGYMSYPEGAAVQFVIAKKAVRFVVPLPSKADKAFTHCQPPRAYIMRTAEASSKLWEQACRQKWRALNLVVKAKLEAVDAKITTMEEEFLAHFVMPNGQTYGQFAIAQVAEAIETGSMPALALPAA